MVKMEWTWDFELSVPDRPGELARLGAELRASRINLRALWAFGIGEGHAEMIVVPEDAEQFRAFADSKGLHYHERKVLHLSSADELGALVETFERIAAAQVNVHSIDAMGVGGQVASYLWVDEKDREALARALNV